MNAENYLTRKKIYLISENQSIAKTIRAVVTSKKGVFFTDSELKHAVADVLAKNPDLVVYDTMMPKGEIDVLLAIKTGKPDMRILMLTKNERPQENYDTTGRGISFHVQRNSDENKLFNAIAHSIRLT